MGRDARAGFAGSGIVPVPGLKLFWSGWWFASRSASTALSIAGSTMRRHGGRTTCRCFRNTLWRECPRNSRLFQSRATRPGGVYCGCNSFLLARPAASARSCLMSGGRSARATDPLQVLCSTDETRSKCRPSIPCSKTYLNRKVARLATWMMLRVSFGKPRLISQQELRGAISRDRHRRQGRSRRQAAVPCAGQHLDRQTSLQRGQACLQQAATCGANSIRSPSTTRALTATCPRCRITFRESGARLLRQAAISSGTNLFGLKG
jgi:hypothetical protein